MITKKQRNIIKKKIIEELTDKEDGIFNKQEGWANYSGTDLSMVVDCVQHALTKLTFKDKE